MPPAVRDFRQNETVRVRYRPPSKTLQAEMLARFFSFTSMEVSFCRPLCGISGKMKRFESSTDHHVKPCRQKCLQGFFVHIDGGFILPPAVRDFGQNETVRVRYRPPPRHGRAMRAPTLGGRRSPFYSFILLDTKCRFAIVRRRSGILFFSGDLSYA